MAQFARVALHFRQFPKNKTQFIYFCPMINFARLKPSRSSFFLLFFWFTSNSFAQVKKFQPSTQIWTDIATMGWISPKIKWQADLQYARQSPYYSWNLWQYEQQLTGRVWVHYYHRPKHRFSAFAGIWGNRAIGDNVNALPNDEYRFAVQYQLYQKVSPNLLMSLRARQELRDLGELNPNFDLALRGRYQVRLHYYLRKQTLNGPQFYLIGFNEFFLRHLKEQSNASLFDQNRIFLGLGCDLSPRFTIEMGYFNQFQRARFTPTYDINSAIQISLVFDRLTSF